MADIHRFHCAYSSVASNVAYLITFMRNTMIHCRWPEDFSLRKNLVMAELSPEAASMEKKL